MKFGLIGGLTLALFYSNAAYAFDQSKAQIVSSVSAVGDLKVIEGALKITLPDGWYTYWRMPGDAGLPPVLTWGNQDNIDAVRVDYPKPKRFITADMHSFGYGYGGDIYLPMTLTPEISGQAVAVELMLDMMICKDICIPERHEISFSLPSGEALPSAHADNIKQAKMNVPSVKDLPRLKLDTAVLGKDSIVVTAQAKDGFIDPEIIIEVKNNSMNAPAEIIQGVDKTRAVFKVKAPDYIEDLTAELFGEHITVTLINHNHAVEKEFQF